MTEPGESLVLRSTDRAASCTLTLCKRVADPYGWDSIVVDIKVQAHGFEGSTKDVYLLRHVLDPFLAELVAFESERSGRIFLCNTGVADATNEFYLWIEAQAGGHAVARVKVFDMVYGVGKRIWEPAEVFVVFEVDGGDLPGFVRDWTRMFGGSTAGS